MPNLFDEILTSLSKIFLVIGLVYVIQKVINKKWYQNTTPLFTKRKQFWYNIHVNISKLSVLAAFAHGLTISPVNQKYLFTGWILGLLMIFLTLLGAFLSIKTSSKPMSQEEDLKWRSIRIIKWILTVTIFPLIALHYFI